MAHCARGFALGLRGPFSAALRRTRVISVPSRLPDFQATLRNNWEQDSELHGKEPAYETGGGTVRFLLYEKWPCHP